jgi:hypothetical protein
VHEYKPTLTNEQRRRIKLEAMEINIGRLRKLCEAHRLPRSRREVRRRRWGRERARAQSQSELCCGFKAIINFFFRLTLRASFVELRTRYIKHAMVSCHARANTEKQQNSNKRSHGISPSPAPSQVLAFRA